MLLEAPAWPGDTAEQQEKTVIRLADTSEGVVQLSPSIFLLLFHALNGLKQCALKPPRWHDGASVLPFGNKFLCGICCGAISDKLYIL